MNKQKKIEEIVLKVAIELARDGEGALFVIGKKVKYSRLLKQRFQKFSIFSSGSVKLLKSLAVIDGAIIINENGQVLDYGAMIKNARPLKGYGTRHAAAVTASKNGNRVILCSEEERKVKIFSDGKYVMQVDALEKNVEKNVSEISEVLESIGIGTIGSLGAVTLVPTLGITLVPGIIVFGGSYYAIRSLISQVKKWRGKL